MKLLDTPNFNNFKMERNGFFGEGKDYGKLFFTQIEESTQFKDLLVVI